MNNMKFRTVTIYFIVSLFFLFSCRAYAEDSIISDENTVRKVLDNGLTIVIHEIRKTPISSIDLVVKAGSAVEGSCPGGGISHLLEHMIFKGSSVKEGVDYDDMIKSLGGHINAFTSQDLTIYYAACPSEGTVEILKIIKGLVFEPYFDALELKKEKEVVLDEIRKNKDDPARLTSDISWQLVFQEHPYRYPIIGFEDLFERIGKKELEDYYLSRYSPDRMTLVIAGDVRKETLLKEIEAIFGPVKRNFVPDLPKIAEAPQLFQRDRVEYRNVSLAHVALSYKSASINDAALYPLDVASIVLGAGEDSILTKELRNKKRLVHHIACENFTLRDAGLFYIYFTAEPDKVNDAIASVLEEVEKIKSGGIGEADLNKVKTIVKAGRIFGLETAEGRARDISTSETVAKDYKFSEKYLEKLSLVAQEDIKYSVTNYLDRKSLNIVRVLPMPKETPAEAPAPPKDYGQKLSKEDMTSGIRIIVAENHATPNCSITAAFLGGVRSENEKTNGVSSITSKLLLDGTLNRDEESIKSEIESRGGGIYSFSGNNSCGIKINLLSEDWKKGIEILSDIIINPQFAEDKIEKEKSLAIAAIKERDDDIISSGLLLFKKNFYKKHPYGLHPLGTAESVANLKRNDILEFYNNIFTPPNLVLTVSGDVDTNSVAEEAKKQFASFEKREPKLPQELTFTVLKEKEEISLSMEREQSIIIIGFPSAKLTDSDRYVFEVMDAVMSGYNGRMYNKIREQLGMGYALGSSYQPGLDIGCYIFYALTARENIKTVEEAIFNEIKTLKDNLASDEELKAVKKFLITAKMQELEINEALGFDISLDELYGLGYKNFELYNEKINDVTAGQIKRAANQYFDMKNCLVVIIYGEGGKT